MHINKKNFNIGLKYSIASTFFTLCTMLLGFLNMHFIGPDLLGLWQSVSIITSYLSFTQLGIQSGLNINLPVLLGNGETSEAHSQIGTALFYALFLSVSIFVISCISIFILFYFQVGWLLILSIITLSIVFISGCLEIHYIATFRSAFAFDQLSKIYLLLGVFSLFSVWLVYYFQYEGMLVYQIILSFLKLGLLRYYAPYKNIIPKFQKYIFLKLLKPGIFLSLISQILKIVESMPRVLLLHFGGVLSVGLFNPALTIGSCVNIIPGQLAQFLQPQFGYKYGQTHCAKDMWQYLLIITLLAPLILLPILCIAWFAIPFVLEFFFPKYLESLWPIRIMLFGFLFSSSFLSRGFLFTIKAFRYAIALGFIDLLFFSIIPILFIIFSSFPLLISIAIGLSLSYFLSYFINIIVVRHVVFLDKFNT